MTPRSAAVQNSSRDGRAAVAQLLVGVAAPVGEEHIVALIERLDFGHQLVEVGRAVNQRLGATADAPGRNLGGRVSSLFRREKPFGEFRHATGITRPGQTQTGARSVKIGHAPSPSPARPGLRAAAPHRLCACDAAIRVAHADQRFRQGRRGDEDRPRHDGREAPEGGDRPGHRRRQGGGDPGRRRLDDRGARHHRTCTSATARSPSPTCPRCC